MLSLYIRGSGDAHVQESHPRLRAGQQGLILVVASDLFLFSRYNILIPRGKRVPLSPISRRAWILVPITTLLLGKEIVISLESGPNKDLKTQTPSARCSG